jgi:hypothetical protein
MSATPARCWRRSREKGSVAHERRVSPNCDVRRRDRMTPLRRLRPSLGNGRLPDFHCKSVTIAPLAPYAPKAKTASECGEVPYIGTKQLLYQIVIADVSDRA